MAVATMVSSVSSMSILKVRRIAGARIFESSIEEEVGHLANSKEQQVAADRLTVVKVCKKKGQRRGRRLAKLDSSSFEAEKLYMRLKSCMMLPAKEDKLSRCLGQASGKHWTIICGGIQSATEDCSSTEHRTHAEV